MGQPRAGVGLVATPVSAWVAMARESASVSSNAMFAP